jgi:hypothetical protein
LLFRDVSPSSLHSQKSFAPGQRVALLALVCALIVIALACGSAGNSTQSSQSAAVQVLISPASAILSPSAQQRFTATVQGSSNSAVSWLASAGSISSDGNFIAPAAGSGTHIVITATSLSNSSQRATSTVIIQTPSNLAIETSSLTTAIVNTSFEAGISATGGTPPYQWSVSGGSLPSGISLQATAGNLGGTPSQVGNYSFTAKVTDAESNSATQNLVLSVSAANNSNYDGPAELPRVYLSTTLADTPAPGATTAVAANGDLQGALNNANCGDTITLQSGATFSGGQVTFPAKPCDDQHWIIVRTSAPDASLPPEGTRMTPCYAGVASLPGRPALNCASTQKVLATISYTGTGEGPIIFANGANHYRLLGLEITRTANDGIPVTALISAALDGSMSQIVLDRLYLHGTPTDETRRGVDLSGGTSIAVQDSYISEFHCRTGGTCTDSQAISGGIGSLPMGPYKIDDNFLEAAGENLIFGGGAATYAPADIEIRFNHLFKPMFWLQGQPGFVAPAFIVKNHFEMKNAQRVLFDSNILEDTWGGFTQHGSSILITPKNQESGTGASTCPQCLVTDVTIRYVTISHVGGALQIANAATVVGGAPLEGERYSIHDVIADDINETTYIGYGNFAQISTVAEPLLQNVEINHVTAFPTHTMLTIGAPNSVQIPGFTFTNNIIATAKYPIWSTGDYGSSDCAYYDVPLKTVDLCFSGFAFSFNAFLGASSAYPPTSWPAGNFFYDPTAVGFVNYNNGVGGDYHLLPTSPAKGKGNDGLDLGANVDAVLSAISGVE